MALSYTDILAALVRTTAYSSLAVLVVSVLLRWLAIQSAWIHRVSWTVVIVQAWFLVPWNVEIAVFKSTARGTESFRQRERHLYRAEREAMSDALGDGQVLDGAGNGQTGTNLGPTSIRQSLVSRAIPFRQLGICCIAIWCAGAGLIILSGVLRYGSFWARVPLGQPPDRSDWEWEWRRLTRPLRTTRTFPVQLRITDSVGPLLCFVPFVHLVLVPRQLWMHIGHPARVAILRHELAHFVRCDLWKSCVLRLLALPQWFNPLIWYAVRRFDEAGEWACDEQATGRDLARRLQYAQCLVQWSELAVTPAGVGHGVFGGALSSRIARIVRSQITEDTWMRKLTLLLALLGLTILHGTSVKLVASETTIPQSDTKVDRFSSTKSVSASAHFTKTYLVGDLGETSDRAIRFDSLVNEITTTIAPNSWLANGGEGRIEILESNQSLIIYQNESAHEKIARFLTVKRQSRPDLQSTGLNPYLIEPPDVLTVKLRIGPSSPFNPIVTSESTVDPDGTINLPKYGSFRVAGLTLEEATKVVERQLAKHVEKPEVTLTIFAYNSKAYYIIADGGAVTGPSVRRILITGNETVLDAISNLKLQTIPNGMRIVRPARDAGQPAQILPIDWDAITHRGETSTNYQMLPGDQLFVSASATERKAGNPFSESPDAVAQLEARLGRIRKELSPAELCLARANASRQQTRAVAAAYAAKTATLDLLIDSHRRQLDSELSCVKAMQELESSGDAVTARNAFREQELQLTAAARDRALDLWNQVRENLPDDQAQVAKELYELMCKQVETCQRELADSDR